MAIRAKADPPVPPPFGIYAAALDVALTAADAEERAAARRLIHSLGGELLDPVRERREQTGPRPRCGISTLIRETLRERLD